MTDAVDPTTAQSLANAQANAGGVPVTSGDLDAPAGDADLDAAMDTVDSVRAYLTDASDPDERMRRADAVEAAEAARDGANRKGVDDAIAQARS